MDSGGVVRGLVIAQSVLALGWLLYVAWLPAELQSGQFIRFVAAMTLGGLLLLLVWLIRRGGKRPAVYWLSAQGGAEITGPFTVAQIVAMWKTGQITTQGMVTETGTEEWVPMLPFMHRFDASLMAPRRNLARNGAALLLLGLILLLFVPPLGGLLCVIGLVLWIVGRSL